MMKSFKNILEELYTLKDQVKHDNRVNHHKHVDIQYLYEAIDALEMLIHVYEIQNNGDETN